MQTTGPQRRRTTSMKRVQDEALAELRSAASIRRTVDVVSYGEIADSSDAALAFYRNYVAQSQPVVVTGMLEDWPALRRWAPGPSSASSTDSQGIIKTQKENAVGALGIDAEYFVSKMTDEFTGKEQDVTVALTPTGWADAVTTILTSSSQIADTASSGNAQQQQQHIAQKEEDLFFGPAEERMGLSRLFTLLQKSHQRMGEVGKVEFTDRRGTVQLSSSSSTPSSSDGSGSSGGEGMGGVHCSAPVAYAQFQNSSLSAEYVPLMADVLPNVKQFGERIFGEACEAQNLWIGGDCSVTSMHQDWYENLYAVVAGGSKDFDLVPWWEAPKLNKRSFPDANWTFRRDDDSTSPQADEKAGSDDVAVVSGWFDAVRTQPVETTPWIKKDIRADPPMRKGNCGGGDGEDEDDDVSVIHVKLQPGQVLYLPAMWFHRVSHSSNIPLSSSSSTTTATTAAGDSERGGAVDDHDDDGTTHCGGPLASSSSSSGVVPAVVAINYWFDMQCGPLYHLHHYMNDIHRQPPETSGD